VRPLGSLLSRPPCYGVNAAASQYAPDAPTYVRITDISPDGRFAPHPKVSVRHPASALYLLRRGDLVFARTGASVGKSYLYRSEDGPLVFAGFLIRITPDADELDPSYLAYFAQSKQYWDWVAVTSVRSGQPGINGKEYAQLPVVVPLIDEQRAIVESLSTVERLITSLAQQVEKKRDIKEAVMQQLLTGRTRLPGYLGEWPTVRLGDHVAYLKTATSSRAELSMHAGVKYLHYGDIHTATGVKLDAISAEMPRLNAERIRAGRLRVGDLVFVDASEDSVGVGKSVEIVGVPGFGVIAGLHTIAARFDKQVLVDGFKAYLQFCPEFRRALLRLAAGTKVLATTRGHVSSVVMRLPGPEEQRAIATVLSDMDAEIAALSARLQKTTDIKRGMLQELLSGRARLVRHEVAA
jgi:type I restriction enzyme S subunit